MSDQLPEGFTVQPVSAGKAPVAAPASAAVPPTPADDSGALPAGFTAQAPAEQSVLPHLWDKFKKGIANMASLPALAADFSFMGKESGEAPGFALGKLKEGIDSVADKVRGAVGLEVDKPLATADKPKSMFDAASKGTNKALRVKNIPAPLDVNGGVSKSNEYMGTIAEFLGANMIPGGGAVAFSGRKLATAVTSVLGSAASGAGAVEGKELGVKMAPSFGLTEEQGAMFGELAGSFTGPGLVGLGSQALLKSGSLMKSAAASQDITGFSKDAQKAAANSLLAKDLQAGLEHAPHSEANLARSLALSAEVEGWNPTIAQASGAPGLVAMQKEVANKSGEALAKAAAADARNAEAIANFKAKSFPANGSKTSQVDLVTGRTFTTDPVTDPARVRLSTTRQVRQMEVEKNANDLRTLSAEYQRSVDNESIGDALRTKYWEARNVAKIQQGAELGDVYATAKRIGIKEDMTDVRDNISKIMNSDRQVFQDPPVLFQKVMREYPVATEASMSRTATMPTGSQKPIYRTVNTPATLGKSDASFEELHSLYKEANKGWADATAAGDSGKAQYMGMIREQLKGKVNKFNGPEYGELADKFAAFNQGYAKYSQTFKEGAGGEIAKRTRSGMATDSEDIVNKVILQAGDKKKGVQDFFEVYGADAGAAKLLNDGLTDSFSKASMKSGTFNPKAANGWLKQHEQAMGELPALRDKFASVAGDAQALVNRRLLLNKQRQVMDRTYLSKVAQSENPDALINKALGDSKDGPKVLKALLVGAITPESKGSIARAIVDVVSQRPNALEYIAANAGTLKPVMDQLGKGHWDNLRKIAEMEGIAARVKAPTQVELSKLQDVGEQVAGTSVKGIFARIMAAKQGRISEGYAVMDVGGRWFYKIRSEEMGRLREAAMFDPDLAGLIAKLGVKKGAPTHGELMNLQHLSFNAGVVSSVEAAGHGRDRADERNGRKD